MRKLIKHLLNSYKVYRTTTAMNEDMKIIKKLDYQLTKYRKTEKKRYLKETKNLLISLHNVLHFDENLRERIAETLDIENRYDYNKIMDDLEDYRHFPLDGEIGNEYSESRKLTF